MILSWLFRICRKKSEPTSTELIQALLAMEGRLTPEFANLKSAIDGAVSAIDLAVTALSGPRDTPADIVAATDELKTAVDKLTAAVNPAP